MAEARSILSVDFGSVHTRAVLLDVVDGEYRLVARGYGRTTNGFPGFDLSIGLRQVVAQINEATGRQMIERNGQVITPVTPDGSGVDLLALSASIGRPLRAVVIGLVPDVSITSAVRATNSIYMDVMAVISLDDGRDEEDRLNAILLNHPDVVLLVGGTEGGAETAVLRSAELVALAVSLTDERRRPAIIYAGNSAVADDVAQRFEDLTDVMVAPNVRPSLEHEYLDGIRLQLARTFDQNRGSRQRSMRDLAAQSATGVQPSAQGAALMAEYLRDTTHENVALIDVGSAATTLSLLFAGTIYASIRTDIGLGHSAPQMIDSVGTDRLRQWLPLYIEESDLQNYMMNKSLRPATVPGTLRDLYLEHALLRAGIRVTLAEVSAAYTEEAPALDRIIAAGAALTLSGSPGMEAMLLLDSLQPTGLTILEADPSGVIPAIGAVAQQVPEAAVQLIEGDSLTRLGVAINISGQPRLDKPAVTLIIEPEDENEAIIEQVVLGGHLWVYALPIGERARVTITCARGLSVGGRRKQTLIMEGGVVGLIVDARGRPLRLMPDVKLLAAQLPLWLHEATGDPLHDVDPSWLVEQQRLLRQPEAPTEDRRTRRRREKAQKDAEKAKSREDLGRRGRRRGKDAAASDDDDDLRRLQDDDTLIGMDDDEDSDDLGALRDVLS